MSLATRHQHIFGKQIPKIHKRTIEIEPDGTYHQQNVSTNCFGNKHTRNVMIDPHNGTHHQRNVWQKDDVFGKSRHTRHTERDAFGHRQHVVNHIKSSDVWGSSSQIRQQKWTNCTGTKQIRRNIVRENDDTMKKIHEHTSIKPDGTKITKRTVQEIPKIRGYSWRSIEYAHY